MKRSKDFNLAFARGYLAGRQSSTGQKSRTLDGISAEEDAEAAKLMREQNQHRPKGEPPWLAIVRGNAGGK
jgi:hypothetical protein